MCSFEEKKVVEVYVVVRLVAHELRIKLVTPMLISISVRNAGLTQTLGCDQVIDRASHRGDRFAFRMNPINHPESRTTHPAGYVS